MEIEQALWTSVRLLEEQAELQQRMSERWKTSGNRPLRDRFASNADDRNYAAGLIRSLITGEEKPAQRGQESLQILREYSAAT